MNKRHYKEHSTGSKFCDSEAFGTEEIGNPGVIAFHKVWKDHITRTLLEPYHAAHHFLSQKTIPLLEVCGTYRGSFDFQDAHTPDDSDYPKKGLPFHAIQLHVLDLDPTDISTACNITTHKESLVTNPKYIDGDCMYTYLHPLDGRMMIINYMREFCYHYGICISSFDSRNFKITKLEDGILHIMCTDLASKVIEFYEDAEDRIGDHNINKHKDHIL